MELSQNQKYILNKFQNEKFIPKIGNSKESSIYKKILSQPRTLNFEERGTENLYLNMRACFWIKVFIAPHTSNEYKTIFFKNQNERNFIYCLLASSLFWWFWVCVSDGWHITSKEIKSFKIPNSYDSEQIRKLAFQLDNKLEETKKFIGTAQTQYEYKHKLCIAEIQQLDNYINSLYGLTESESAYIKNFALPYRTSAGVAK